MTMTRYTCQLCRETQSEDDIACYCARCYFKAVEAHAADIQSAKDNDLSRQEQISRLVREIDRLKHELFALHYPDYCACGEKKIKGECPLGENER